MTGLGAAIAVVLATFAPQAKRVEEKVPLPAGKVRVSGTVVALDAEGVAHREEDGTLELAQSAFDRQVVDVRDGRWEALLNEKSGFGLVAITLRGRSLNLESFEDFEPPYDRPIELAAAWVSEVALHVVAAGSGEELTGVEIVEARRSDGARRFPRELTPERVVMSAAVSPIAMGRRGSYWVRAPGRAWSQLYLSASESDDVTIELAESCALEVMATGGELAKEITLQVDLWLEDDDLLPTWQVMQLLPESGRIELTGLPPCRVRVAAGLDFADRRWWGHVVNLGEAAATLAPGAPSHVTLALTPVPSGLDADGTVERSGRVVLTGPGGSEPSKADGSVTFLCVAPPPMEVRESGRYRMRRATGLLLYHREHVGDERPSVRLEVEIRNGGFRLRVPCGCTLAVSALTLDGREYAIDSNLENFDKLVRFDSMSEPLLLAWPADAPAFGDPLPFTLRVVDAVTKSDLPRVRIVLANDDRRERGAAHAHPGLPVPDERLVDSMTSPFHPPMPRGRAPWPAWVGADGYTWAKFELKKEGSATVELQPAADLEIEVANESLPDGVRIEVRRIVAPDEFDRELDQTIAAWRADGATRPLPFEASTVEEFRKRAFEEMEAWWRGTTPLPSFGVGTAVTSALLGETRRVELAGVPRAFLLVSLAIQGGRGTHWLAFAPIDARGGGRHRVRLSASESVMPISSPLGGTLFVPPEWGPLSHGLEIAPFKVELLADQEPIVIPVEELLPVARTPGLYRWKCGPLMNGTWIASLDEFGFCQPIELGPAGLDDVELVVPPPAELRAKCVDATTGEPVPVDSLVFSLDTPRLDWMHYHGRRLIDVPSPSDRLVFRAPVGTVDLEIDPDHYAPLDQSVVVPSGGIDVVLRFWRDLGIRIRWTQGETEIEKRAGYATKVTDSEGRDVLVNVPDATRRGMTLVLSRPGRHRITLPHLRGYQPIAPLDVETRAGEYVEVAVELIAEK
jgi:hypothetical protein